MSELEWRKQIPEHRRLLEGEFSDEGGKFFYEYVHFRLNDRVKLDGEFGVEELRAILDALLTEQVT